MTDIVERLRRGATNGVLIPCEDLVKAADIIEQYRADAAYDECTINFLKAGGAAQEAKHCGDQPHDHRVYFMCQSCEDHNPEGAVGPRSDIAVMPDGTWLCDGCYSDCDKSAYGLIASDVDDFEFPRFEDLPRPAPYGAPSVPSAQRGPLPDEGFW